MKCNFTRLTAMVLSLVLALTTFVSLPVSKVSGATFSGNGWSFDYDSGTLTLTTNRGTFDWRSFEGFGKDAVLSVVIEDGVTEINQSAFLECTKLESVTIADSVTLIGNSAFSGCESLTSITLPESVTTIGGYAFHATTNLAEIAIPDSVVEIGYAAFGETSANPLETNQSAWLKNQPEGVVYAGKVALTYKGTMPNNTTLSFRADTKGIARSAFSGNNRLVAVTIPDGVVNIGSRAFFYSNLSEIMLPDSVTTIGSSAFSYSPNLSEITIPDSVTTIGANAFENTAWLDAQDDGLVYAGKVAYIWKGDMPEDTVITLPLGTKGISGSAFRNLENLIEITIPATVESIVEFSFSQCVGLMTVTFKSIYPQMPDYHGAGLNIFNFAETSQLTLYVPIGSKDEYAKRFWGSANFIEIEVPCEICPDVCVHCILCKGEPCTVGGFCVADGTCEVDCGKHNCDFELETETIDIEIIDEDEKIGTVDIFAGSILIEDTEQSGELTITTEQLNGAKTDNMYLFKIDGDTVSKADKPTFNDDGSVTVNVENGSTYVLQRIQPGNVTGKGKVTGNRSDITINDALHTLMAVAKMQSSDAYGANADARCVQAAKVNNPDATEIVIADALHVLMFVANMSSSKVKLLQA